MSPRSTTLNERLRAQSRAAIREAALEAFGEFGFHAASMSGIALRAGVSKALIYRYFASKEELLLELVEHRTAGGVRLWENLPPDLPPRERLGRMFDEAIARVRADDTFHRLYLGLLLQPAVTRAVARIAERTRPVRTAYYQAIERAYEEMGWRDGAARALLFQMTLHGLAQALLVQPDFEDSENFPLTGVREMLLAFPGEAERR
jgi:AcrR family transcriptional regulator